MTDSSITNAPLKDLLDTYAAKIQEFNAWPDGWRAERRLAAREAVEAYVGELEMHPVLAWCLCPHCQTGFIQTFSALPKEPAK
jgi:hypothetical protein